MASRRRRRLPWALLAALVGGCGDSSDPEPGAGTTPGVPLAVADPAELVARLAARTLRPPAPDVDEARWGTDVRLAVLQGAHARWRVTLRSWQARLPSAGTATVRRAEIAPPGSDPAVDGGWIRLTACASAPDLAAAEHAAYLTPLEAAGCFVRPWPALGVPAFVSNLDDPRLETFSWHRGCLAVSAAGLPPAQVLALHASLERAGLYGDVPASPPPPEAAARPSTPDAEQPAPPAPAPPAPDADGSFAGRWSGGTAKEHMTLQLRADGTFEASEVRSSRISTAQGTWSPHAGGISLTVTHDEGKPLARRVEVTGTLVGGALELRSSASKDVIVVRRVR